jgi:hypothetical protein
MAPQFAVFVSIPWRLLDEIGVGAAIMLTLLGTALNMYLPRLQMSTEEQVKDRELTDEEARRKVRFYRRSGWCVTLVGVLVLIFVMIDILQW